MDNNSKEALLNVLKEESTKNFGAIIDKIEDHTINIANGKYDQGKLNELISMYQLYFVLISTSIPKDPFYVDLGERILGCIDQFIKFCKEYQKKKGWVQEV